MMRSLRSALLSAMLGVALLPVACNDSGTGPTGPAPVASVVPLTTVTLTGDVGSAVPDSVAVRVLDAAGNGIVGVSVQFTTAAAGGNASPATVTSGANGIARTLWTLGSAAGTQTLEVRTGSSTVTALVVQATARAAAPAQVQKAGGDQSTAPAGSPVPLSVLVVDRFGNPTAGVSVTWQTVAGGGSVTPATSLSDASGRALAQWTLGVVGDNRVSASVSGSVAATFTAVATQAPVASVTITPHAPTVAMGQQVALVTTVRDAAGNELTGRTVSYQSANAAVATVSSAGVVQAVALGQALITASSEGVSDQAQVTVTSAAPPTAPSALTASAASSSRIELTWQDNSSTETTFELENQAAGATAWTLVATLGPNLTQYSHTSLSPATTYVYRIRACANAACSAYSSTVSATTASAGPGSAPSVTTERTISITRDPMGGPDAATVSSQTIPNGLSTTTWFEWGTSPTLAGAASTPPKDAGAGTTPFENLQSQFGLAQATTYYYRGVAQNSAGITRGAILSFTTVQPSAPQGVQVALSATGLGVVVTWTHAGENGTSSYAIKRREGTTTVPVAGLDDPTWRSATDSTYALNASHTFFYAVVACNYLGCSTSAEVSITTPPLAAPSALTVTGTTATSVSLSWTDNASNEMAYWVFRRVVGQTPGGAALVGQLPANATSFTDDGTATTGPGAPGAPVTGTTYFYFVLAQGRVTTVYNPDNASAPSNEVQVVPGGTGTGTPPSVTTERTISISRDPMGGPDAATITGQTIPNGLSTTTWFEWGTSPTLAGAASTPPKDAGAGTTPFENLQSLFGLAQATTYYYRVVAQNSAGITRGAILSFTTDQTSAPQQVQVALSATGLGVVVTWTHAGENGTLSYGIKRREGTTTVAAGGFNYSPLRSVTDSTYTLNTSHTFFYSAVACNFLGCATSAEVSITTPALAAPSALTVTGTTATSVSLSWTDNAANETAYWVYRRSVGPTAAFVIGRLPANATSFTDDGTAMAGPGAPVTGTTYLYYVVAQGRVTTVNNPDNASAPSNEVQVVPGGTGSGTPPSVTTERTISISRDPMGGPDAATITGQTIPNGLSTTTWFEWGTSPTLAGAASTPAKDAGAGTTPFENLQSLFGLAQATTYYYRVVAQNSAGITRGAILSFTTDRTSAPQVQVALSATGLGVVVSWTHAGENGTMLYQIKRREGTTTVTAGGFNYSPSRSVTDSTYTLNTSHTFFYVVEACNFVGCTPSAEASITTPALAAPSALTVTGSTATTVSLSWADNAANETAYWVYRRSVGPTAALVIGQLPANATSFTDDGTAMAGPGAPVTGTTYFYYVVAQGRPSPINNPNNYSAPSNEVQVVP